MKFKLEDLSPNAKSGAKDIADTFRDFTASELSNLQSLEPSLTVGEIPDLDQYPIVIAEYDVQPCQYWCDSKLTSNSLPLSRRPSLTSLRVGRLYFSHIRMRFERRVRTS